MSPPRGDIDRDGQQELFVPDTISGIHTLAAISGFDDNDINPACNQFAVSTVAPSAGKPPHPPPLPPSPPKRFRNSGRQSICIFDLTTAQLAPLQATGGTLQLTSRSGPAIGSWTRSPTDQITVVRQRGATFLAAGFGIRNKVRPFNSLLILAGQDTATPIPTQAGMLGSHVALDIFSQYVWQEATRYAEYRNNTAYLFAAEGMDELLLLAPPDFAPAASGWVLLRDSPDRM